MRPRSVGRQGQNLSESGPSAEHPVGGVLDSIEESLFAEFPPKVGIYNLLMPPLHELKGDGYWAVARQSLEQAKEGPLGLGEGVIITYIDDAGAIDGPIEGLE